MFTLLMGLKSVAPKALQEMKQHTQVNIFDVNARQSWLKERVPGATSLDPVNFVAQDLPDDKNATLVFYCSNPLCRKAPNAAKRAKKFGYENVLVMSAGITGWCAAQLPTEGW